VTPNTPTEAVFTATTSDYVKDSKVDDKTIMDGFTPLWNAGDQIVVWGNDGTAHRCSTTDSGSTKASFSYDSVPQGSVKAPYTAVFPTHVYISPTRVRLPSSQNSETGILTDAPMYATSNTTDLTFQNLCGVVRIKLTGNMANRIYYVILNSKQRINGDFDLVEDTAKGDCPQLSYVGGGSTSTVLLVTNPTKGDGSYYVALPAGTYNSLSVFLYTLDRTQSSAILAEDSPVTIRQGAVTSFTLNDLTFHEVGE